MTLPFERKLAVNRVRDFLRRLLDPKETPRIPKSMRQEAKSLLKHYPTEFDMNKAERDAPDVFGDWK